jgi:hypothetical protein
LAPTPRPAKKGARMDDDTDDADDADNANVTFTNRGACDD